MACHSCWQNGKDGVNGTDGKNGTNGKSAYELAVDHGYTGTEEEWLESLKGTGTGTGTNGKDGKDGKSAYQIAVDNGYQGTASEWLESLKGTAGSNGKSAYEIAVDNGFEGTETEWLASLAGKTGAYGKDGKSAYELAKDNGFTGSLSEWLDSLIGQDGKDGVDGKDGKNGLSAYELAVQNGYEGSLTEWLASLVGKNGADGKSAYQLAVDNGYVGTLQEWLATLVGAAGEDGKSAYEIAVEHGYQGSESAWLNSLSGKDGKSAYEIAVEYGYTGTKEEWLASLNGKDGKDGANGINGVGVKNAYVNSDKHLILVLDNGNEIDAGYVGVKDTTEPSTTYTVVFKDYDGSVLKTETVAAGKSATAPTAPDREGYVFSKWDKTFTNVTSNMIVTAQYTKITNPTIVLDNAITSSGETVSVRMRMMNNPGIAASTFKVMYDDSVLTLENVTFNQEFGGDFDELGKLTSPVSVSWSSMSNINSNATFLTLNFKVKNDCGGKTANISVAARSGDFCNINEDDVNFDIINGTVTIK